MSFTKKTWVDRVSENPNRRTLTIISKDENTQVVDVARTEGEVSKEGDAFNAENMNDLESRVEAALGEKLDGQKLESDPAAILEKTKADGSAPDLFRAAGVCAGESGAGRFHGLHGQPSGHRAPDTQ